MDRSVSGAALAAALLFTSAPLAAQEWPVHSPDRPRPPVVDPGPAGPPASVPRDAIVLFDGRDLSAWQKEGGGAPGWRVADGYVEVVSGSGTIETRRAFGDIQLHIEWATPATVSADGQNRGNSGVFLMGLYEVQVLDSYDNDTYPDGQAAALYGQAPPLVNACRPPGQWQTYDIIFRAPRFNSDGSLESPARVTVLHNGVLVHDNAAFHGQTAHMRRATYVAHADRLPIRLQDHGDPVRYRNVWVRELNRRE